MADAVRAAGAVVWREVDGRLEVAVVHRPRYDDWSLPKGKLDGDEPWAVAACREVREETGLSGPLGRSLGTTQYDVLLAGSLTPKTVRWWAMEALDGRFEATAEVDELRWIGVDEGVRRLDPSREGAVLARFAAAPARTGTVLLVRHATAGSRDDWEGHDALRPLDVRGVEQSRRLAEALACWRPTAVVSAPPVRCRQTVAGLGLPVQTDARLGEDGLDVPAASDALLALAGTAGEAAVVCSQGGVVPALVAALTGNGVARARKASTWVLSVHEGRSVAAGYLPEP